MISTQLHLLPRVAGASSPRLLSEVLGLLTFYVSDLALRLNQYDWTLH